MLFETDYHKFIQIQSLLVLEVVLVVLVVLVELVDAKLEMISWSSNKYLFQYAHHT
jgi:hypothetical protein